MAELYPLFLDLEGQPAVVIGGGVIAQRKVESLLTCGAVTKLISPEITPPLQKLVEEGRISWVQRKYETGDLAQADLAIIACGVDEVNRQAWQEARAKKILINVVDVPEMCTFQVPAVVQRGTLRIAISTGGQSPALAKHLRRKLEGVIGPEYEEFVAELGKLRDWLRQNVPTQPQRAQIMEDVVNSEALELLRAGKREDFLQLIEAKKSEIRSQKSE